MTARTLTVDELGRRLRQPSSRLGPLLAADMERGIVEQHEGGYRLTADAEVKHGAALRGITWERS